MYDINSNLLTKSGLTAGQLQAAEAAMKSDNGYHADFWQALVDAENAYDLNALFILAHADVESAHGTSNYATTRNNLFGFNAVDSDPDLASAYSSQAVSVHDYADFLNSHYLKEGEEYWGGAATAHGMFVHYSSSHDAEAEEVVGIMNTLLGHVSGAPAPDLNPEPAQPSGDSYAVKSGDNMSAIAAAHGLSLAQLEQMNPQAGHPAGNFGVIWPGDELTIGGNSPAPVQETQYVTVESGDNLSVIAERAGTSLAQVEALNPNAGHPAGNFNNIWPGDQVRVK
jgi:LysM repeat protein